MKPLVSIIIPVYNSEMYIEECIRSVISQTYKNIEIIIVNDGSIDKSEEIIKNLMNEDNRIKYITQENSGPSKSRNNGIDNSNGDYIFFVDSDDTVDNNYIEYMLNEIINKKKDIVCCGYTDISKYGTCKVDDFKNEDNLNKENFLQMACNGTAGVLWSKIFKKDIIINNNIRLNEEIFMCEDLIFVLEYISKCKSFGVIDDSLYNYNRLNDSSISSKISINYLNNHIRVCKNIDNILKASNLSDLQIESIITSRLQSLVIILLEIESKCLIKGGLKQHFSNIKCILTNEYIKKYRVKFNINDYIYKPYISFIKNESILMTHIYGNILNIIKLIHWNLKYKNRQRT